MNNLDKNDLEYIKRELTALQGNLEQGKDLVIFDTRDNNIYIWLDTRENIDRFDLTYDYYNTYYNNYIYRVRSIEELKGWLYGIVQEKNNIISSFEAKIASQESKKNTLSDLLDEANEVLDNIDEKE